MSILPGLISTLMIYQLAKWLYRQSGCLALSPLMVCPLVIIPALQLLHVSYESYNAGAQLLNYMLQPATVALAVPLYRYRKVIQEHMLEIALYVFCGAVVAIVTSVGAAGLAGLPVQIADSLAPRSVTTPIAMNISQIVGGSPALTAAFVIITGLVGTICASLALKYLQINNPVTRGMMLGISAHGNGMSKAHELGYLEGASASLAMIFMGLITAFIAPGLVPVCLKLFAGA